MYLVMLCKKKQWSEEDLVGDAFDIVKPAKPIMFQQKVKQCHISQSSFLWNQEMSFFLPSFLIRFSGFRMISFFLIGQSCFFVLVITIW